MAKRSSASSPFDASKFENVHQVGGIRTGTLDAVAPGALSGMPSRVAFVDTGGGLRFVVALDRGGDIVDASLNQHNLAYLSPNGLLPPNHAYHRSLEWLRGWPGGMVTTCGPQYVGGPREEDGVQTSLHGNYSNTPAAVEMLINPDPQRGVNDMLLSLITRDTRMFGPVIEVRRLIRCTLGKNEITFEDEVTNRGNKRSAHHWLYHCNFGFPLLDEGARFVYAGKASYWEAPPPAGETSIMREVSAAHKNGIKRVPAPLKEHAGTGERGLVIETKDNAQGLTRVGLINDRLKLGVELAYSSKQLPRLANWQHYGPAGSYVVGLEPFSGSLMGKANDSYKGAEQYIEPGESRRYKLVIRVHNTAEGLRDLAKADGKIV